MASPARRTAWGDLEAWQMIGYLRYRQLTEALQNLAAERPEIFSLTSIGTSFEGRDIWLMTCTRKDTGPAEQKPGLWVDGNIHAAEVAPSAACLHLLQTLARRDGKDAAVTALLDTRVFFVVPRLNPDGAELALAERPVFLRSSARRYPDWPGLPEGFQMEDIDGDGRVRFMRFEDSNGPWKACEVEPRLMVRRQPEDVIGKFYRVLPEGLLAGHHDGVTYPEQLLTQRLDLNRNFPAFWRPECEQEGAGPYPTSEPEVRAAVDFITRHPNICIGVAHHTYSGALLRPYSTDPDDNFPGEDLWAYQFLGRRGSQLTGYPAISVFHDFRYHPDEVIGGTFDEWMYHHLGVYGWTVEIWSAQRQAGIHQGFDVKTRSGDFRFIDWAREHPLDEDRALLRWSDEKLDGEGYADWQVFAHPQLGEVEIGGWDFMNFLRNPPLKFLRAELEPLTEWVIWMGHTTPRLGIGKQKVRSLGADLYELELVIENRGWFPTCVSKRAEQLKMVPEIRVALELDANIALEQGREVTLAGQLAGRSHLPPAPFRQKVYPSDDRVRLTWLLRAPQGGQVEIEVAHPRAGTLRRSLRLG